MKKHADQDDVRQIFFDTFMKVLNKFGVNLNDAAKTCIRDSFPGRSDGNRPRIIITKLYDVKYT
jgi:hypothetical protein